MKEKASNSNSENCPFGLTLALKSAIAELMHWGLICKFA